MLLTPTYRERLQRTLGCRCNCNALTADAGATPARNFLLDCVNWGLSEFPLRSKPGSSQHLGQYRLLRNFSDQSGIRSYRLNWRLDPTIRTAIADILGL